MIMKALSGVQQEGELDFEDIKRPAKIRDINKTEKKNCISISAFDYENKQKYPKYVSKV